MLKHDSIEDKEEFKKIFQSVELETEKVLKDKGIKRDLDIYMFLKNIKKEY